MFAPTNKIQSTSAQSCTTRYHQVQGVLSNPGCHQLLSADRSHVTLTPHHDEWTNPHCLTRLHYTLMTRPIYSGRGWRGSPHSVWIEVKVCCDRAGPLIFQVWSDNFIPVVWSIDCIREVPCTWKTLAWVWGYFSGLFAATGKTHKNRFHCSLCSTTFYWDTDMYT